MKYINTKTGNIIETPGVISGGDWKPVEEGKAPKQPKQPKGPKAPKQPKGEKAQDGNAGADKT